eukprot:COSAG05_NODE_3573_length_1984_cov_2.962334_3_plen_88_part_01
MGTSRWVTVRCFNEPRREMLLWALLLQIGTASAVQAGRCKSGGEAMRIPVGPHKSVESNRMLPFREGNHSCPQRHKYSEMVSHPLQLT